MLRSRGSWLLCGRFAGLSKASQFRPFIASCSPKDSFCQTRDNPASNTYRLLSVFHLDLDSNLATRYKVLCSILEMRRRDRSILKQSNNVLCGKFKRKKEQEEAKVNKKRVSWRELFELEKRSNEQ